MIEPYRNAGVLTRLDCRASASNAAKVKGRQAEEGEYGVMNSAMGL